MPGNLIEFVPTLTNGVIAWQACYTKSGSPPEPCQGPPNYAPVTLDKGNVDQVFVFSIKDTSNLGVKFAPSVDQALWIQPNTKPTGPVIQPQGQIVSASRVNDTMLVFLDKNNGANQLLKYRLNFVGSNGNAVTAVDPDIRNGGGRTPISSQAAVLLAFGAGLALALLLTVLWFKVLSPNRKRP